MMRPEPGIVVFPSFRRRNKALFLTDITGAPHADKAAFEQIVGVFVMECQGFSEDGEVMGVTTDDLDETIFTWYERFIVDTARIRFPKSSLTALGEKPLGYRHMLEPVNFMLIRHAVRSAIDDYRGLIQSLLDLVSGLHTKLFEVTHSLRGYGELRTAPDEIFDFCAVAQQGAILVESNLVHFELCAKI